MSEPTPGPWNVSEDVGRPFVRPNICRMNISNPEHKANAHLIAAAPELLEAAKEVCRLAGRDGVNTSLAKAITKAEGRK